MADYTPLTPLRPAAGKRDGCRTRKRLSRGFPVIAETRGFPRYGRLAFPYTDSSLLNYDPGGVQRQMHSNGGINPDGMYSGPRQTAGTAQTPAPPSRTPTSGRQTSLTVAGQLPATPRAIAHSSMIRCSRPVGLHHQQPWEHGYHRGPEREHGGYPHLRQRRGGGARWTRRKCRESRWHGLWTVRPSYGQSSMANRRLGSPSRPRFSS